MPNIVDIWERLSTAPVLIDQTRCARVRNRNAQCSCCADACTTGCISYADNQITINPDKCIGCATCATACPTDALQAKKPTDAQFHHSCLAAAQANAGVAVIACEQLLGAAANLFDASKVVSVPCLGRVDEALSVHLAAAGAAGIVLVKGPCDSCEYSRGIAVASRAATSANVLLETWGSPVRISIREKMPASVKAPDSLGYDQARRAFFLEAKDTAADTAAVVADSVIEDTFDLHEAPPSRFVHVDEKGTLAHSISPRRQLLAECLADLARRYGGPADIMIDTRLMSEVVIDTETCNGCRMCATFCPSGSNFKFKTKSGQVGVKHRVADCTNCRLCFDICPTDALTLSDEIFAVDVDGRVVERFLMPNAPTTHNRSDSILQAVRSQFRDGGRYVVEQGDSKQS